MAEQQFYRHPDTGEVFELKPVKVDDDQVKKDYEAALRESKRIDTLVNQLETKRDNLQRQLDPINDKLGPLLDEQEAANERLTFCESRYEGVDQAPTADWLADDGAEGEAGEGVDGDGEDDEDGEGPLDASNDAEADPDEPDEEEDDAAEDELVVPVRRRAAV